METKPKTRHPEIAMLISRNKWRTVKLRAKGSDEGLAIAAVDALFYTGRFRELNNVIAHRLDDPALRNSDESNAIVKHILERLRRDSRESHTLIAYWGKSAKDRFIFGIEQIFLLVVKSRRKQMR